MGMALSVEQQTGSPLFKGEQNLPQSYRDTDD